MAARRKLLFITSSLVLGGAEKHVVTLLNELDTERFDLALAYLKPSHQLLPQLRSERLAGGVTALNMAGPLELGAARRLAALIDQQQIDLVVCTNGFALGYGSLARWLSRRRPKLVEVFHTTELGTFKSRLQMALYWPLFAASEMLVYVCHYQRQYWQARRLKARRDTVIHNGINVDYFRDTQSAADKLATRARYGLDEHDCVIGLCAVMRPEKMHVDLLQAIARLRARGLPVKALFIGDGVERPRIAARIAELGLQDAVRITGFADDVRPLIAACDAMALVSHHVETFSIAALEAMALGKPMIMSRIGGAGEQVTPGVNGYLFERGDIAALAEAIERCLDREHCRQMGERARAVVVEQFSLRAMVDRFSDTFHQLLPLAQHGQG